MAITTVYTYELNGSLKDFNVPFEYLARRFVTVTLIGTDRKELVLTNDFRFTSKSTVQTTKAWGPGDGYELIEIRRNTSATDRLVDFADGSILRAYELNIAQIQTMHIAEEARNLVADTIGVNNDGDLDARARRIVNLADATEPGHAVTLRQEQEWASSTLSQANRAKAEADRSTTQADASTTKANAAAASQAAAKTSETNAKTSETNAKTSETNAKTSETNALASEAAAKKSEDAALVSKNAAGTSEANAEAHAANLGNAVGFYSLVESVADGVATFKPAQGINAPVLRVSGSPVWHWGSFDPESKLSVIANGGGFGKTAVFGRIFTDLDASSQVYNSGIELRENGLVGNAGPLPGHVYSAPGITFHWATVSVKKLWMNHVGQLCWGDPNGAFVVIAS